MSECTCYWTDPKTWEYYSGVAEPGSQMEPNPDCPEHFPGDRTRQLTEWWEAGSMTAEEVKRAILDASGLGDA